MKELKLTIPGNVISKKNFQRILSKWIACPKYGKKKIPFIMPSDAYVNWEEYALLYLMKQPIWMGSYPVELHCTFYRETKQKFDFSNMIESIQDTLVKAGTITDDSYRHVIPCRPSMVIDKENPRTEVIIYDTK